MYFQVGRMTGIATQTVEIGPINQKGFFVAFKVSFYNDNLFSTKNGKQVSQPGLKGGHDHKYSI
jgi:hypothetical protein